MEEVDVSSAEKPARRPPWNKGKIVGAKPPLRPSHVWSIRTKLQMECRKRDLALFNLAIDSKLRGCDLVAVRVRGRGAERLRGGSRDHSSEEDRTAGSVRADGSVADGDR